MPKDLLWSATYSLAQEKWVELTVKYTWYTISPIYLIMWIRSRGCRSCGTCCRQEKMKQTTGMIECVGSIPPLYFSTAGNQYRLWPNTYLWFSKANPHPSSSLSSRRIISACSHLFLLLIAHFVRRSLC